MLWKHSLNQANVAYAICYYSAVLTCPSLLNNVHDYQILFFITCIWLNPQTPKMEFILMMSWLATWVNLAHSGFPRFVPQEKALFLAITAASLVKMAGHGLVLFCFSFYLEVFVQKNEKKRAWTLSNHLEQMHIYWALFACLTCLRYLYRVIKIGNFLEFSLWIKKILSNLDPFPEPSVTTHISGTTSLAVLGYHQF